MQYERYEEKMLRVRNGLLHFRRHAFLYCTLFAAAVLLFSGFAAVKGTFLKPASADDSVYGDELRCSASALFSGVSFSFGKTGEETFTDERALKPGAYTLRAASNGLFGKRYSTASFSVAKRVLIISPKDDGQLPPSILSGSWNVILPVCCTTDELMQALTFRGLAEGDKVVYCALEEPPELPGTRLCRVDESALRIENAAGEDVTNCYELRTQTFSALFQKRFLCAVSNSIDKIYDCAELERTLDLTGTLIEGDEVEVYFPPVPTAVGVYDNLFKLTVKNNGKDCTERYEVDCSYGKIQIRQRPITIISGSAEKVYDKTPLICREYTIEGELVQGHRAEISFLKEAVDAGEYGNAFNVGIVDETNVSVTENYAIVQKYGTLRITPVVLTIATGSAEKEYDGLPLTNPEWKLVAGNVLEGDWLAVDVTGTITDPGTVDNKFEFSVYADGVYVTKNYRAERECGTLTVLPNEKWMRDYYDRTQGGEGSTQIAKDPPEVKKGTVCLVNCSAMGPLYLRALAYGQYNGYGFSRVTLQLPYTGIVPMSYTYSTLEKMRIQPSSAQIILTDASAPWVAVDYAKLPKKVTKDCDTEFAVYDPNGQNRRYEMLCYPDYNGYTFDTSVDNLIEYRTAAKWYYTDVPEYLKPVLERFSSGASLTRSSTISEIAEAVRKAGVYNADFASYPEKADIVTYFLETGKEGICQHFAAAGTMIFRYLGYPARYTEGFCVQSSANEWTPVPWSSAHAWVEVFVEGVGWVRVDVTPGSPGSGGSGGSGGENGSDVEFDPDDRTLVLKAADGEMEYSGAALTCSGWSLIYGKPQPGHKIFASVSGSRSMIGSDTSQITGYRVVDAQGKDVTGEYTVVLLPGTLTVTERKLVIVTASAEKTFDGDPLRAPDYWIREGSLIAGHTLVLNMEAKQTAVGTKQNDVSGCAVVEYNNYQEGSFKAQTVTEYYEIVFEYGTLRVTEP